MNRTFTRVLITATLGIAAAWSSAPIAEADLFDWNSGYPYGGGYYNYGVGYGGNYGPYGSYYAPYSSSYGPGVVYYGTSYWPMDTTAYNTAGTCCGTPSSCCATCCSPCSSGCGGTSCGSISCCGASNVSPNGKPVPTPDSKFNSSQYDDSMRSKQNPANRVQPPNANEPAGAAGGSSPPSSSSGTAKPAEKEPYRRNSEPGSTVGPNGQPAEKAKPADNSPEPNEFLPPETPDPNKTTPNGQPPGKAGDQGTNNTQPTFRNEANKLILPPADTKEKAPIKNLPDESPAAGEATGSDKLKPRDTKPQDNKENSPKATDLQELPTWRLAGVHPVRGIRISQRPIAIPERLSTTPSHWALLPGTLGLERN